MCSRRQTEGMERERESERTLNSSYQPLPGQLPLHSVWSGCCMHTTSLQPHTPPESLSAPACIHACTCTCTWVQYYNTGTCTCVYIHVHMFSVCIHEIYSEGGAPRGFTPLDLSLVFPPWKLTQKSYLTMRSCMPWQTWNFQLSISLAVYGILITHNIQCTVVVTLKKQPPLYYCH